MLSFLMTPLQEGRNYGYLTHLKRNYTMYARNAKNKNKHNKIKNKTKQKYIHTKNLPIEGHSTVHGGHIWRSTKSSCRDHACTKWHHSRITIHICKWPHGRIQSAIPIWWWIAWHPSHKHIIS